MVCSMRYDVPISSLSEECLTCSLSESCRYTSANFAPNANFYLLNCLGPDVPASYLRSSYNNSHGDYNKKVKRLEVVYSP